MEFKILVLVFFTGITILRGEDLGALDKKLNNVVTNVLANSITIENANPDGFLTKQMLEVDQIGQKVMLMEQSEDVLKIQEKALALLSALRERRLFRYMAWAEYRLEMSEKKPYDRLKKFSEEDRIKMYNLLGDINIDLITENILSRAIISRQAEIYDTLSAENKIQVRRLSIAKQAGPLKNGNDFKRRKTLDEF